MPDPLTFAALTPRHGLPLLFAGQAQKEVLVNESLFLIDALLHPLAEAVVEEPPADPEPGACWLVGPVPTGAFVGHAHALAAWDGSAFLFASPREGMAVRLHGGGIVRWTGGEWLAEGAPAAPSGGAFVDAEARGAIVTLIEALGRAGVFSA